jgi:uncharacterized FlgJ-related protein
MWKRSLFVLLTCATAVVFSWGSESQQPQGKKLAAASTRNPARKLGAQETARDEIFGCDCVVEAMKSISLLNSYSRTDRIFFIKIIASTICRINEIIMEHRNFVLYVREKQCSCEELTTEEAELFKKICRFYQTNVFSELMMRIAPVPVSLAIAQAAIESKFGSDKTIHRLNAYFGLAKSRTVLVKFDNLFNSAIAYTKTLNVHKYYREFREQRELMINESGKIDGIKLATCIKNYGTNKNYRKLVLQLMRQYKLDELYD